MVDEEYWWEITQQWGGDTATGRVSMCRTFKFQLDSLVCMCVCAYVCVYTHIYSWQYVCSTYSIYTCTKLWLVPNLRGPNYCVSHGVCVCVCAHRETPYSFLHSSPTPLRSNPNVLLSTLFSNTLSRCPSFDVKDQVPHPTLTP